VEDSGPDREATFVPMSRARVLVAGFVAALVVSAGCTSDEAPRGSGVAAPSTTSTVPPESTPAPGVPSPPRTPVMPAASVWVHLFDDTLKTPEGVESMLDEVAEAGLDAVIAQVARRHDAYYRSDVLPATPDPALAEDFDVLEALIDGGRARGLQVHAWFVVAPAYHEQYDELELPDGHVWLEHGPESLESWLSVDVDGVVGEYLDVGLDDVHAHVEAIVVDIAERYPVDGIHLDYVRYDGARWGYHPEALDRFAAATGRSDRPAPDDPEWREWRTARTAALVERASRALADVRPEARLSAAVIAAGEGPGPDREAFADSRPATEMLQNWPGWLEAGHLDFVVAMAYMREGVPDQADWFDQWVLFGDRLSEAHPGRVVIGVGAYLNSVDDAQAQLEQARQATGHVAIYSYQQDSAEEERGRLLAGCCQG
jgi:uncharacterized lipoprotein YddW (UPF0748 family)